MRTNTELCNRIDALTTDIESTAAYCKRLEETGQKHSETWTIHNRRVWAMRDEIEVLRWVLESGDKNKPDWYGMARAHVGDPNPTKALTYAMLALCDRMDRR